MKKLLSFIIFLIIIAVTTVPAFAEIMPRKTSSGSAEPGIKKELLQQNRVGNYKEKAQKEITRRITSLKKLIERIISFKKISLDQKAALTIEVQTEIDTLTALQTKIAADTDTQQLKTDVQSIVTTYRVFALFIPQINIIASGDRILTIADQFNTLIEKFNNKISEEQQNGKDVTVLQQTLTDIKAKVADSKVQAQNAIDLVTPLTPEGYPGNKTILQNARKVIKAGQTDLTSARHEVSKVLSGVSGDKTPKTIKLEKEHNATPSGTQKIGE